VPSSSSSSGVTLLLPVLLPPPPPTRGSGCRRRIRRRWARNGGPHAQCVLRRGAAAVRVTGRRSQVSPGRVCFFPLAAADTRRPRRRRRRRRLRLRQHHHPEGSKQAAPHGDPPLPGTVRIAAASCWGSGSRARRGTTGHTLVAVLLLLLMMMMPLFGAVVRRLNPTNGSQNDTEVRAPTFRPCVTPAHLARQVRQFFLFSGRVCSRLHLASQVRICLFTSTWLARSEHFCYFLFVLTLASQARVLLLPPVELGPNNSFVVVYFLLVLTWLASLVVL
jgi:hypothetical protein